MTFRATIPAADDAFNRLRAQAAASKSYLSTQRAAMVQPTVGSGTVVSVVQHFGQAVAFMDSVSSTPGLAQYAKDQTSDQTYDVVAEYTSMRTAMGQARDNLIAMFPKDGNGFLLYQTFNADGSVSNRNFTSAQVAPAVTLIDAVIASIA